MLADAKAGRGESRTWDALSGNLFDEAALVITCMQYTDIHY